MRYARPHSGRRWGKWANFRFTAAPEASVRSRQPPLLAETRVVPLGRAVALPAIGAAGPGCEVRQDVGLGMACGAFSVTRKSGENPLTLKLVTEGAVGAKPRSRVQALLFVQVLRMREPEQERLRLAELGIGTQVVRATGLQGGMARLAQADTRMALKVLLMAGDALCVTWTGQDHRFRLLRHMAVTAFQAQLTHVAIMACGSRPEGLRPPLPPNCSAAKATATAVSSTPADESGPALSAGDKCKRSQVHPAHFARRDSGRAILLRTIRASSPIPCDRFEIVAGWA